MNAYVHGALGHCGERALAMAQGQQFGKHGHPSLMAITGHVLQGLGWLHSQESRFRTPAPTWTGRRVTRGLLTSGLGPAAGTLALSPPSAGPLGASILQ